MRRALLTILQTYFLVLLLVAGTGCGPRPIQHEFSLAPGQGHHPGLSKVLLIPINETEAPPAGLDVADHAISDLVKNYLKSKGLEVETLNSASFRRALGVSTKSTKREMLSGDGTSTSASINFSDVVPALLEELQSDAQLVVVPNVAIRSADYVGTKTIKWDGVKRREKVGGGSITGSGIPVASLHTVIFSREGPEIFSAYGGLDAIFETNFSKAKYELKEDLLQDEEFLAEGVCVSFHPFFGMEEYCR